MRSLKRDANKVERKVIAVDFDGTLVFNNYPFINNPNVELIEYIKSHREHTWILWTCREGQQLKFAVDYLKAEHDLEFDFVNRNDPLLVEKYGVDSRKIGADIYIDDRNVDWRDLLGE